MEDKKNDQEGTPYWPIIKEDHIASDSCSFCGTHETCGHYFRAIKEIFWGYEDERGSFVLVNTCGDYSWICKTCWTKIKKVLEEG